MIGYDASLKESIEQIKTALYYPDGGLPLLITGESGTGKSYLVNLVYQYCLLHDLLEDSAPFITFNCAQYADNPELLTSNLFGHVKERTLVQKKIKKGLLKQQMVGSCF
ncbi:sigma-54 factor interaction domain-containing protein [Enterococcus faecium]|nr:sigma-54 factor interaction domain-containing protein [Enterococcus faecium]